MTGRNAFASTVMITVLTATLAIAPRPTHGLPPPDVHQDVVHVVYQPSSEDFANPERGFAENHLPRPPAHVTWDSCGAGNNFTAYSDTTLTDPLRLSDLTAARAAGRTLIYVRYHIALFRDAPLSDGFLAQVAKDFSTARAAGVKLVPRFAYNYGTGGPDAPLFRVLQHLDQLGPVLRRNVDVLAYMELGFIGCWGEGGQSSNNLANDEQGLTAATPLILQKEFSVVPQERMIAVRAPIWKFQYFGSYGVPSAPLTEQQAYNGSIQARWGEGDDCLTCGEFNSGTWSSTPYPFWTNAPLVRAFLADDNRYLVQDGEPGVPGPATAVDSDQDGYTSNYDSCARVLSIFANEHWSAIDGYATTPAQRWQRDGCYATIATHLGYRFRLLSATLPVRAKRGAPLPIQISIHNDGWATPFNPRAVELVLRDEHTGVETRIPLYADPRHWSPASTVALSLSPVLPATLRPGRYDLFVALPDPAPSLHDRPEYAIQLANQGVWDARCGCNSLRTSVFVTGANPNPK